jgi:hypothetical protein
MLSIVLFVTLSMIYIVSCSFSSAQAVNFGGSLALAGRPDFDGYEKSS